MKAKIWLPLLIAGVLGLVAAYLAFSLASAKPEAVAVEAPKFVDVVTAAVPVEAGVRVEATHLTVINVQAGDQTANAFNAINDVVGRVALTRISTGQIMLSDALADPETGAGLQALLPVGMRAITLNLDDATAASNFLVPDCRIDLIGRIPAGRGEGSEDMARAIVQNIRVLAVGRQTSAVRRERNFADGEAPGQQGNDRAARTITVEVSVEQANALELAYRSGATPRVVMRPHGDRDAVDVAGVTLTALRGEAAQKGGTTFDRPLGGDRFGPGGDTTFTSGDARLVDADAPAAASRTITVIRGGVETTVQVAEPGRATTGDRPSLNIAGMLGELLPDLPDAFDGDDIHDTQDTDDAGLSGGGLDDPIDE